MKDIHIEIEHLGPAATHNLMCWICNENKAVYHQYPNWYFGPCWECDANIGGRLYRIRSRLAKWILENLS